MDTTPTSQQTPKKPNGTLKWAILVVVLVVAVVGVMYAMTRNTSTSNSNTNANQNTKVTVNNNVNAVTSSNSSLDTSKWVTYDSSTSSMMVFRNLKPPYKVSYPRGWTVLEELGGLYLGENIREDYQRTINISWIDQKLTGDLFEQCKKYNGFGSPDKPMPSIVKYDNQRSLSVDGKASVLVSFRLEPDNFGGAADTTIVCVPTKEKTMLVSIKPRLSTFATDYFNAILTSIDIAE